MNSRAASAQLVVVDQAGGRVGAVAALVEHLAGDVRPEAVGEVTAGVQRHAEHPLVAQLAAQREPVGLGEVVDLAGLGLACSAGDLHPVGQDRPEGDQVGVDARVRLHVRVRGAEELPGVLGGERLDGVDVLAAGVEAAPDGALGVLVAEPVAHRQQGGGGGVVLAGDELERLALVGQLRGDGVGDPRLHGADHLQRAAEGGGLGVRRRGHATSSRRAKAQALGRRPHDGAASRWFAHPHAPVTARGDPTGSQLRQGSRHLVEQLTGEEPDPAEPGNQPLPADGVGVRGPAGGLGGLGAAGEQPGEDAGQHVAAAGGAQPGVGALLPPAAAVPGRRRGRTC